MFRQRLIVVILGVPAIFGLVWLGGLPYRLVWLVALGMTAFEYSAMLKALKVSHQPLLTILGTILLAAVVGLPHPVLLSLGVAIVCCAHLLWAIGVGQRSEKLPFYGWMLSMAGAVYLGVLGGHFVALRFLPAGVWWVTLSLGCVWLTDSAAYFCGKRFGKTKFSPYISPNKTWEGYWGGVVAAGACGAILPAIAPFIWGNDFPIQILAGLGLGLLIGLFSPIGDLAISIIKRQAGVKDTGTVLLGHGGVLDRIDSWFITGALAFYYVWMLEYWALLFNR